MKGQCLCARVVFELTPPIPDLYQCHCSLCRQVSGAASNAAMIIPARQFNWIQGEHDIRQFTTDGGFKSHFCEHCGSPLPNLTRDDTAYWVPAGLLQESEGFNVAAHLYVESKASWDQVSTQPQCFAEMPDADTLEQLLNANIRE
jgi:hypothetical protein